MTVSISREDSPRVFIFIRKKEEPRLVVKVSSLNRNSLVHQLFLGDSSGFEETKVSDVIPETTFIYIDGVITCSWYDKEADAMSSFMVPIGSDYQSLTLGELIDSTKRIQEKIRTDSPGVIITKHDLRG